MAMIGADKGIRRQGGKRERGQVMVLLRWQFWLALVTAFMAGVSVGGRLQQFLQPWIK